MDSEAKVWLIFCGLVVFAVALGLGGCQIYNKTEREFIKAGYTQQYFPGQGVYWVKP